jgi:hypothetical protein
MKLASFILSLMLALGFVFMYASDSHAVLKDGLVAYYSFNDGTAKDNSGNGNNGKIIGAPKSVAGKTGNCLDFNGKTDAIDVADSAKVQMPDAFTVALWINVRTFVDHAAIVWKGEKIGWGANFNYRIATTPDGGLTWGTTNAGNENYFATAAAADVAKWNFVCMTADGTTCIGYVSKDGTTLTKPASAESNPKPSPAPYNVWVGQPLRIGYSQGYNNDLNDLRYFDGLMDEVVLYNRALSEVEIIELMSANIATTAVKASDKIASTWGEVKSY